MPVLLLDTAARLAIVRAMITHESITAIALPDGAWLRVFNHAGHVGIDLIHQETDFFDGGSVGCFGGRLRGSENPPRLGVTKKAVLPTAFLHEFVATAHAST